MVVCTFAGHREVFGLGQSQVVEIFERLLEVEQEMTCYVGGNRNMFCYIAPKCKTCSPYFYNQNPLAFTIQNCDRSTTSHSKSFQTFFNSCRKPNVFNNILGFFFAI